MTRVLVLNSGSSSIKYQLIEMPAERALLRGEVKDLGAGTGTSLPEQYDQALEQVFTALGSNDVGVVGHRVVHGGSEFFAASLIDDRVTAGIDRLSLLAPLHNPPNVAGIRAAHRLMPHVPQVAVFDTAFHQTMPEVAARYPIPTALADQFAIRRYGFHGTSCAWCLSAAARHYAKPSSALNLIVAHLGAGASVTAIRAGQSVDTSMGLSPLEGLMMQTRSGDLDPAVVLLLLRSGMPLDEIDAMLNRQSGVMAIASDSDMRRVAERSLAGDAPSTLARQMYAYRAAKYVASYVVATWPLDAVVFTGGIGENDLAMCALICDHLRYLGLAIDPKANQAQLVQPLGSIAAHDSTIDVLVIKANEELQIARDTMAVIQARNAVADVSGST